MNARTIGALAVIAALALTGCAGSKPSADDDTSHTLTHYGPEGPHPSESPRLPEGRAVFHLPAPVVWSSGGVELRVLAVGVNSRAFVEDLIDNVSPSPFSPDTQSVFVIKVEAINNSGRVVAWYPDQGEVVLGDEQVHAAMWLSDNVGHTDWQPGIRRTGNIMWEMTAAFEQVKATRTARILVSSVTDSANWSDKIADAMDLTLDWTGVEATAE